MPTTEKLLSNYFMAHADKSRPCWYQVMIRTKWRTDNDSGWSEWKPYRGRHYKTIKAYIQAFKAITKGRYDRGSHYNIDYEFKGQIYQPSYLQ